MAASAASPTVFTATVAAISATAITAHPGRPRLTSKQDNKILRDFFIIGSLSAKQQRHHRGVINQINHGVTRQSVGKYHGLFD